MRGFLSALSFLTVVPVPRRVHSDLAGLRASLGWYPAVGILLGAVNWAVFSMLAGTPVVAALGATVAAFVMTRGLHVDGLADSADALMAGGTPARRHEILKDPRHGTFGVLAIVLDVLSRVIILASVGPTAPMAVFIMPVVGRWAMVYSLSRTAYDPKGKLKAAAAGAGKQSLGWATVTVVGVGALFGRLGGHTEWAQAIAAVGMLLLIVPAWLKVVRTRLGAVPGDAMGALNEGAELLVLCLFYAFGR